jgi:hypothetical protein
MSSKNMSFGGWLAIAIGVATALAVAFSQSGAAS